VQRRQRLAHELPLRAERLRHAARALLRLQQQRLQGHTQRLQALDPGAVLARGYAWVEGDDGRPVTRVQALAPGAAVQGVWADGRAALRVESVQPGASPTRP
jgi:exodeoxyribonuclease VII large subunit